MMHPMTDSSLRHAVDRPRLLNVGCGTHVHPDWVNVDIAPAARGVLAVDLRKGLPFPGESFDAVYCSHVLEHLGREEAAAFLVRIHGLLRPGGILRVVVPDLEAIARIYLELLAALEHDPDARQADYDWILLEMYDQTVRGESGGDMARYLADPQLRNPEFVRSRIGAEAVGIREAARCPAGASRLEFLRARGLRRLLTELRLRLACAMAAVIGGARARRAYAEGLFRQSGEVHRWMYDAYSLACALRRAGFAKPARQTAFDSRIPEFARYRLDADEEGSVRKPDSLFMEAERAPATVGEQR
jgi:SAM-dependent methyltransferase